MRLANALAEDLYGLGRFGELANLLNPLLGDASGRELLRARRITGVAFRRLGHRELAVGQLGACLQACVNDLGQRHELTLTVCLSYANALRACEQFDSALHYCGLAADGYRAALGPDHPLVQVAQVNAAAVHLTRGDREQAAKVLGAAYDALADSVGEGHPFTVLTAVNRAFAVPTSAPEPVWSWPRQAYEQARKLFGPGHLDTLLAAAGFALTRAARDEEDGLAPSLDHILSELRRRFGSDRDLVTRVACGMAIVVDIELPSA